MRAGLPDLPALLPALALIPLSCSVFDPVDLGSTGDLRNEFELVWSTFDGEYVNFHFSNADWDALHAQYGAMADQAGSQADLEAIIFDMCSELDDPGIRIAGEPTRILEVEPNYDMGVLWSYLEPQGFTWVHQGIWGWCRFGNSLYFMIEHWAVDNTELDSVIESQPGVEEFIFDVRMNSGNIMWAFLGEVCRTFNDEVRIGYYTVGRSGPGREDLGRMVPRYISQTEDCFTGPVAVLIGEDNMHVSEQFACMVSEIPNVTTMGDTTMRYSDHLTSFSLPFDVTYTVPDSTIIRADSVTWVHQAGVPPDIFVDASEEDFAAGVDPVLEYALEWAGEAPTR